MRLLIRWCVVSLLMLALAVNVLSQSGPQCIITTLNPTPVYASPDYNADSPATLEAGITRTAIGQRRGADSFIWWLLEDQTWVRADVVIETENCVNLPLAPDTPAEPAPVIVTPAPESTPDLPPAEVTDLPDSALILADSFDNPDTDDTLHLKRTPDDPRLLIHNLTDSTGIVLRDPYALTIDLLSFEESAGNSCLVIAFDILPRFDRVRYFQLCQDSTWAFYDSTDESPLYSDDITLPAFALPESNPDDEAYTPLQLSLLVTESVYVLLLNDEPVAQVRGNGVILGGTGVGMSTASDAADSTLTARFDDLLIRRLTPGAVSQIETLRVCPPSGSRVSPSAGLAESCLQGVLEGVWLDNCFCETTDRRLESLLANPPNTLTVLADQTGVCITCTPVTDDSGTRLICDLNSAQDTLQITLIQQSDALPGQSVFTDGAFCEAD